LWIFLLAEMETGHRETSRKAEEEAGRMNEAAGGWSREPDLSKRVI